VWDVDVIGVPSNLSVIHKVAVFGRVSPTLDLSCDENTTQTTRLTYTGYYIGSLFIYT
jgi:hypothetical protein